jgi:hypothetical protein
MPDMISMKVSLPELLKRFVDEQVRDCGYASSARSKGTVASPIFARRQLS